MAVETPALASDFVVALAPLGIGQLRNKQNVKGYILMTSEAALLITNLTTYFTLENMTVDGRFFARKDLDTARTYKIINLASFSALVVAVLYGAIDGVYYRTKALLRKPKESHSWTPRLSVVPTGDPRRGMGVGVQLGFRF
jgi:hypothetical protein